MIRTLITISLFLFSISFESQLAAQATTQQPARKLAPNSSQWALLIGVSNYPGAINDLQFPGADARSIKELLISSAGFAEDHVRLLTDDGVGEAKATKQNIFSVIDQYLAPRVQPGHEIISFLAGHGVVRGLGTEARSYYLPVDVDAQTKESLERTAVDMEELSRKLSMLKASQFTVFYDACREDPYPEGATLSINGQQAGRGPIQKDLPPNQYTVRAELPGFQPAETRVNVITGYRQEITITLQPLTADSNYEKGIQFEKQRLLPQAIASYQQSLLEDSNSIAAYERLAQACEDR